MIARKRKNNCITQSGLEKKIEYADEQINAYLTAMNKSDTESSDLKEKLEAYQQLKEKYESQNQLSHMALAAKELLDMEEMRVVADKRNLFITQRKMCMFALIIENSIFLKILLIMD